MNRHLILEVLSQKSLLSDLKILPCSTKSPGDEPVFLSLDEPWVYRKGTEPLPQRGTTTWTRSGMTHVVSTERQPGVTSKNFTEKRTFGLELKNDRDEQQ